MEHSWASSGRSWPPPDRFLGVQNQAFFKHWPKMSSKRPSGSILGDLGKDLGGFGRIWEGFWKVLGGIWEDFDVLDKSWADLGNALHDLALMGRFGICLA